ncbi:MAG: hypothetical protein GX922_02015 [Firmicutes bacterium]|jgi:hypothetical protein|nr:hypothetical protein [Bacillota bacterium]
MKSSLFSQVKEREVEGEIFQVTHRILQVPREVYAQVMCGHPEPFSEQGAQYFVEQYLGWLGEKDGVIGLVRFDEEDGEILLDAAVRYRINSLARPSCP